MVFPFCLRAGQSSRCAQEIAGVRERHNNTGGLQPEWSGQFIDASGATRSDGETSAYGNWMDWRGHQEESPALPLSSCPCFSGTNCSDQTKDVTALGLVAKAPRFDVTYSAQPTRPCGLSRSFVHEELQALLGIEGFKA